MFQRLASLIGKEGLEKIKNVRVLLVGIGGVGGYALETLVRSGFHNLTIVDGDTIDESNLNRQIIALNNNIGKIKIEEAKKRVLAINSSLILKIIGEFLTIDNLSLLLNDEYDYIIDACDDVKIKIELIKFAKLNNIKIITCLGTGRKLNSSLVEITTLNKTFNDPLAKKLRSELRKENINLNIPVVFSKEDAKKTEGVVGSAVFVPAVAGIYLANYVFLDIIKSSK